MMDWEKLLAQLAAVKAAPVPFLVALLVSAGLIAWATNWGYSTIITNRDSEIALLKSQRDDYKDKLNGATPDQAKARVDTLEARLARLEPRRLTESQKTELAARLRTITSSILIYTDIACVDCRGLAADFARVFAIAGWGVQNGMAMGGITNMPPHGMAVRCADINNLPPEARTVVDAMRAVGMNFDVQPGPPMTVQIPGAPATLVMILLTTPATN